MASRKISVTGSDFSLNSTPVWIVDIYLNGMTLAQAIGAFGWAAVDLPPGVPALVYDSVGLWSVTKTITGEGEEAVHSGTYEAVTDVRPSDVGWVRSFVGAINGPGKIGAFDADLNLPAPDAELSSTGWFAILDDTVIAAYQSADILSGIGSPITLSTLAKHLDTSSEFISRIKDAMNFQMSDVIDDNFTAPAFTGNLASRSETSVNLPMLFTDIDALELGGTSGHTAGVHYYEGVADEMTPGTSRTLDIDLNAKVFAILRVLSLGTKHRIRAYSSDEARTADVDRAVGVDPTGNHGVIFDIILDADEAYEFSPVVVGTSLVVDAEDPALPFYPTGNTLYLRLDNLHETSTISNITLHYVDLVPES